MTPHILIIEDEAAQREILRYNIESAGFHVTQAADGEEGVLRAQENPPDLIVLDWMMPNRSGIEVCRILRKQNATQDIPIIMLSAKTEEVDKIQGLDMGADDYVSKPYSISELLARIRSHLRRARPTAVGQTLRYDDITLDAETHRVVRANNDIKLGPVEFRLLSTFMEHPSRVWSRDQLLDRAWGRDVYVETRTVDVHVGRLRKALMEFGGGDPIRTVRGTGYALT